MKLSLLLICLVINCTLGILTQNEAGFTKPLLDFSTKDDYEQMLFVNYLDHLNQADKRLYYQRFWVSTESFDKEKGPIFLYICGEYTCSVPYTREFPHQLAQKHGGLFLVLEHRYYGDSQPFDDWTTESLKYLTIENALADTAFFLATVNDELQTKYGGEKRKVVVVGGSYPGAVSAWMRYKYPHIVDASISSSGVVKAILDYDMYDYQIYNSTSKTENCAGVIQNMTYAIDMFMKFNHTHELNKVKSTFGAENLSDKDFAMFFSDQFAGKVQYGARTEMCLALNKTAFSDIWTQYNATRDYFGEIEDAEMYSIDYLRNTTVDINKNMRQWTYQTCTEVAYFQTAYTQRRMRPEIIDLQYYKDTCTEAFGNGIWPDVNHTNILLGDTHLTRTNIFFTNGVEDPWKWAGEMTVPKHSGMEAQVVDCDDCAHCVELYTPKDSDSKALKEARSKIEHWLDEILRTKHINIRQKVEELIQ